MTLWLNNPEIEIFGFYLPWGLVIASLGFLLAWAVVLGLQALNLTRHIWQLPLFFAGLVILAACLIGLIFAP